METIGNPHNKIPTLVLRSSSLLLIVLGFSVIVGWYTQNDFLVQILPSYGPMPFNAAISFLSFGFGFLALTFKRPRLTLLCGSIILLISGLTLLEYLFGLNLGIDQLFLKPYLLDETSFDGRIPLNSTLAFIASGLALLLLGSNLRFRKRDLLLALLGSMVFAISLLAFLGYLTEVSYAYSWGQFNRMAFHGSIAFSLIALSILSLAWTEGETESSTLPRWLPLWVSLTVLIISVGLWQSLLILEKSQSVQLVKMVGDHAKNDFKAQVQFRLDALQQMGEHWMDSDSNAQSQWKLEDTLAISRLDGFQSISWLDPQLNSYWPVSHTQDQVDETEKLVKDERIKKYIAAAREKRAMTVTTSVDLLSGGKGFLIVVPVYQEANFEGCILGVFQFKKLLDAIWQQNIPGFAVSFYEGETPIYSPYTDLVVQDHLQRISLDFYGLPWQVRVWPLSLGVIKTETTLPWLTLVLGLVLAFLLGWVLHLRLVASKQARRLRETVAELQNQIQERLRAEEALQKSEELYRILARNLPDSFVLLFDRDLRLMLAEGTALTKSGFPHEGVEGKTLSEVLPPKDYARLLTYYQSALNGIENIFEDYYDDRVYLARSVPIRNEQGEIFAGMMLSQEITTLKKAEQILAEEKERLAVTLRSIGDGVITTDLKGIITLQNRVAEQLTGWKQQEAIGQPLTTVFQIINEATRLPQSNPVEETLATGQVVALKNHTLLIARNGTERPIADSCAPISDRMSNIIGTVLVFRDMTEQKRLNEELLKSSKLEAIGVLAGGIAHDFNNLLSGIMGFLDLTRFYLENENRPQNEIIGLLEQAQKATLRSKELTLQLLTFAKGGLPVKKTIQLDQIIRESASFALHGTSVEPIFDLPDELWSAEVDPGQLGQVIQNLVLNAVQAMPSGGRIKIQAENLNLTNGAIPPLEAGKYTKLLIRDEGTGISPETLQNIFDPYFTTKSTGSGLGLAVCYSIIKKHDGLITVESVVGKGTTFQIYLPASNHLVEINEPLPRTVFPLDMNSSSRKLLVMDDDALLRDMIRRLARLLGYEVALAKDGQEAVELYRIALQTGQPFSIVLLDLTIPGGLGGKETIVKLLELDPHVKAIVCSGYSSDPVMSDYRKYGFSEMLLKPYQLKDLRLVLERLSMASSGLNSAI